MIAKGFLREGSKRFSRNSGVVTTPALIYMGAIIHPSSIRMKIAINSNCPTANPLAAPEPANPIKCSLEILAAKIESPMVIHPTFLPARK